MKTPLNILVLEDNESDADLLCRELKQSGLKFIAKVVQNRMDFELALSNFKPDLILSDYALPSFDAVTAFQIKQKKYSDIPFIIVSGIIGEENAVQLIKDGVTDYVSKEKLFTLSTKIDRALSDAKIRKEKAFIAEKLKAQTLELLQANKVLLRQNQEKEIRTADLITLSGSLRRQQEELREANKKLIKQEEKVKVINLALSKLNHELERRVVHRTRELTESETRFRTMMETIPQIAWTNTIKGKVIFHNQRWYEYTGLNRRKTQLQGLKAIIHPDDHDSCLIQFHATLKNTDGGEFQIRAKRADGLYRWHLIRLVPIFDEQQQVQDWIGTATDIQELMVLQQQKDDFISIASHELKTPITSLKASLQLLSRMKDNPSVKVFPVLMDQANRSLNKVNVLIEDLLNASMANEGQLHIKKKKLNVVNLISDCCFDVRAEGVYKIITKGDLDIEVDADAVRIEQVIVNFVNNAIKYAPASKEILIDVEKINDHLKVAVIDRGQGIEKEKLPHLFERYYQVENSGNNYRGLGLGLGLYICAEIIKKHHGKIGVDSKLGEGSTFWFTLPLTGSAAKLI